jgi:hypothetical protein
MLNRRKATITHSKLLTLLKLSLLKHRASYFYCGANWQSNTLPGTIKITAWVTFQLSSSWEMIEQITPNMVWMMVD